MKQFPLRVNKRILVLIIVWHSSIVTFFFFRTDFNWTINQSPSGHSFLKFLQQVCWKGLRGAVRWVFPCISTVSSSDAPVTPLGRAEISLLLSKNKKTKKPRSSEEKSFFGLLFRRHFNSCVAHAKKNNTRAHTRHPLANTCSAHQSPIPDRNPKSRVQFLSHSQIMIDDNSPPPTFPPRATII